MEFFRNDIIAFYVFLWLLFSTHTHSFSPLIKFTCHLKYENRIFRDGKIREHVFGQQATSYKSFELFTSRKLEPDIDSSPITPKLSGLKKNLDIATNLFPLWVLSFSIVGIIQPVLLSWFSPFVTIALGLTMICMGMSLTIKDFVNVFKSPQYVLLGFLSQYTIMPLLAYFITKLFAFSSDLSAGIILVGCAPGGTASNLVTLIAQADVALSVLMTAASTTAAVFMTPFLTSQLVKSTIPIDASALVLSTAQVVLLPIIIGLTLNTNFPSFCASTSQYTPFLSVLLVAMTCGSISANNSQVIRILPSKQLVIALMMLHTGGFLIGYFISRLVGANEQRSRTVSIETGMQNSALAAVLANNFPNPLITSIPGCLSATIHSLIGSTLAFFWRRNDQIEIDRNRNQRIK
mmetsp:Transcript_24976/g.25190  ORF Transcript_24976/g.25190 Transcript_24976/m.25190 type:complete len:406 (+) Transcript_24976:79-1296(+)